MLTENIYKLCRVKVVPRADLDRLDQRAKL